MKKNKALFLDRDGVINKIVVRNNRQTSPRSFEEFELSPGIARILSTAKERGFLNIIATSQPEVVRGLIAREEVERMHDFIRSNLAIDDILVCFHDDADHCECRKPKPGLLTQAAKKWNIDLRTAFMVGDTYKDVEAGRAAGAVTILVNAFYNQDAQPDHRIETLEEILNFI